MPARAQTISLAELVSTAAARGGDDVVIQCGESRLTFAELDRAVANLAADLVDRGIQPGDPVAVLAEVGLEFPVAAYGILRAGAVVVPISAASPPAEVTALLQAARIEMVISDLEHEDAAWRSATAYDRRCGVVTVDITSAYSDGDRLSMQELIAGPQPEPAPTVAAGSPAVILFTSGSTGHAKGVVHSHESLYRNCFSVVYDMVGLTHRDVMLGTIPLAHSFGISAVLNASLLAGARLELLPRFDVNEAWRLVRERGITVLTGVPTMYRRMAERQQATRNTDLRVAVVSGSPCPKSVARAVTQWMGIPLIERYGMTEASPLTWRRLGDDAAEGDVGRPGWGVHIRAVGPSGAALPAGKVGELEVRAPSMMLRYINPQDTVEALHDGWLRTGDLGMVRADGGITLTGRIKEVILRGGYTIASREVQLVLQQHRAVAEAAVVGIPDFDLGEEVAAAVILRPGISATVEELERHVGERLAAWKRPRLWRILEELPRTALGKVRREGLLELFAE
jgi:long-chain acyl-CoA synthetase